MSIIRGEIFSSFLCIDGLVCVCAGETWCSDGSCFGVWMVVELFTLVTSVVDR